MLRYSIEQQVNKNEYMKQLYTKKPSEFQKQPKQETVQFLINFSKSLSVVKTKSNFLIELNLN